MANRYWVGGTAAWDATAASKWSLTSGGAGGEAVPTAADDVFFDAASGAVTVSGNVARVCNNLDYTGFTGTSSGTGTIAISGNLTMSAGMTRTHTGAITFNSTNGAGSRTINFNGKTMANATTFNGAGSTWTLASAWNNTAAAITLTAGVFDTANFSVTTTGTLSISGSTTRTCTLGSSAVSCGTWTATTVTNLTFTANTATITMTGNTTFNGGGRTYGGTVNLTGSTNTIAGANSIVTLNWGSASASSFTMSATQTTTTMSFSAGNTRATVSLAANQTVSGNLTITGGGDGAGGSVTFPLYFASSVRGTARTVTVGGTTTLNYVVFEDITAAGAGGGWSGTYVGDCFGNSNITFSTPRTLYWVRPFADMEFFGDGGWATSSGGTGGEPDPLPQDTAIFDANSTTGASTFARLNQGATMPNLDTSAIDASLQISGFNTPLFYGGFVGSSLLVMNFSTPELRGRSSFNITRNGCTFYGATGVVMSCFGGTYTLQDAYTANPAPFVLTTGTWDTNGQATTVTSFNAGTTGTRALTLGASTFTVVEGSLTFRSGLTVSAASATIIMTSTTTATQQFQSSNVTIGTFGLEGTGVRQVTFQGNTSFLTVTVGTLYSSGGVARTASANATLVTFTVSVTMDGFRGTSGNILTIAQTLDGSLSFSKSSGVVSCDYMNITNSAAGGGATFYAGANSTDSGLNSGWIFAAAPTVPTVVTDPATGVGDTSATANGEIEDDGGGGDAVSRGFVYDIVSHSLPGDIPPGDTDYAYNVEESGTFGIGTYSLSLTSLTAETEYFVRAFAENDEGYAYGNEISFTTDASPPPSEFGFLNEDDDD